MRTESDIVLLPDEALRQIQKCYPEGLATLLDMSTTEPGAGLPYRVVLFPDRRVILWHHESRAPYACIAQTITMDEARYMYPLVRWSLGPLIKIPEGTRVERVRCPSCNEPRPAHGAEAYAFEPPHRLVYPCCNAACKGHWGTGCYHCHDPNFISRGLVITHLGPKSFDLRFLDGAILRIDSVNDCRQLDDGSVCIVDGMGHGRVFKATTLRAFAGEGDRTTPGELGDASAHNIDEDRLLLLLDDEHGEDPVTETGQVDTGSLPRCEDHEDAEAVVRWRGKLTCAKHFCGILRTTHGDDIRSSSAPLFPSDARCVFWNGETDMRSRRCGAPAVVAYRHLGEDKPSCGVCLLRMVASFGEGGVRPLLPGVPGPPKDEPKMHDGALERCEMLDQHNVSCHKVAVAMRGRVPICTECLLSVMRAGDSSRGAEIQPLDLGALAQSVEEAQAARREKQLSARLDRLQADMDRWDYAQLRRYMTKVGSAIWSAVEDLDDVPEDLHLADVVSKHLQRGNIIRDGNW